MKKQSIETILAANLRLLMTESQYLNSQKKLASRSGVGQTTISRILRNVGASPEIETVADLAEAFGLQAADLLNPKLFAVDVNEKAGKYNALAIGKDERELLSIFKILPKSGRLAMLAAAHREMELSGYKLPTRTRQQIAANGD